ncbi:hypothetical protein LZ31DRAFT_547922 [Colletotrichum somersetense]|nr:hypothetical protein LZ31DRAFT_547922 [Colletotrichum somersetense]
MSSGHRLVVRLRSRANKKGAGLSRSWFAGAVSPRSTQAAAITTLGTRRHHIRTGMLLSDLFIGCLQRNAKQRTVKPPGPVAWLFGDTSHQEWSQAT